ncbi:hypothetical protein CLIM01_01166 [Colletotrichum limetticola]|uniref:Uncharacterized protein n=1 Tax=Colletotrichum limetticola TaxID=1209924 RepID=A0ABQ9QCM6_9PEZI|nr:hypothetical protein CLIM01_01166 [Colletotrichum limetticola]
MERLTLGRCHLQDVIVVAPPSLPHQLGSASVPSAGAASRRSFPSPSQRPECVIPFSPHKMRAVCPQHWNIRRRF